MVLLSSSQIHVPSPHVGTALHPGYLFSPQKTPALHLYAYHSSVWLCCKGVAFVYMY